jgi:hypothetical protein
MSGGRIEGLVGRAIWRSDDLYEPTRQELVWQLRKPDRFPEVIVEAQTIDDVTAAVRWARDRGKRVSARSGGHAWAGSSVRDDGVLVSLASFDEVEIDSEAMVAVVGPAATGRELDVRLAEQNLFFPVGHCPTVGVGGFVLGGGYGWWSHHYGQAALNVVAVDVVTPDGELIRADGEQNTDWFWAARGAGPGFFGIVVRFHLRLHPRPPVVMETAYVFEWGAREAVFRWAWKARTVLDDHVEFAIIPTVAPGEDGEERWVIAVGANVIADTVEQGQARLEPITSCPLSSQALAYESPHETTVQDMFDVQDRLNPPGYRYAVDNMWTSASVDEVLPLINEAYDSLPTKRSILLWYHWVPQKLPDVALSSQGEIWLSVYAIYDDQARDAEYQEWVTGLMRRHEAVSDGTQISDENLGARFDRPLSEGNLARLDELRARHDPAGISHGFPRPAAPSATEIDDQVY